MDNVLTWSVVDAWNWFAYQPGGFPAVVIIVVMTTLIVVIKRRG